MTTREIQIDVRADEYPDTTFTPFHIVAAFVATFEHLVTGGIEENCVPIELRKKFERVQRAAVVGWACVAPFVPIGELYGYEGELLKVEAWRRDILPSFQAFIAAIVEYCRHEKREDVAFVCYVRGFSSPPWLGLLSHARVTYRFS